MLYENIRGKQIKRAEFSQTATFQETNLTVLDFLGPKLKYDVFVCDSNGILKMLGFNPDLTPVMYYEFMNMTSILLQLKEEKDKKDSES